MKQTTSLFALAALLIFGACQQREAAESTGTVQAPAALSSTNLSPEQLGALGAEIRKDPARGDELLQQHGLTRAAFEKAIREITENAEASRRYAEAYRKARA